MYLSEGHLPLCREKDEVQISKFITGGRILSKIICLFTNTKVEGKPFSITGIQIFLHVKNFLHKSTNGFCIEQAAVAKGLTREGRDGKLS
ncbi:hypothetical protein HNY73_010707 [Argiope bruennichi]|uniref:Uncharacterized protein n=1 Tax=Argiope bruennichi TaxID=94029 RepID=A0A8T0F2R0_ARGBR|nr:hypothetical protein HNY73_010707 [Argiope bruennichi]